ncbi:MAG: hypothetical protein HQK49_12355 [Oligoflexia bacterium]|nr:hypothetical protein [Oligoflexia bacterium]
MKKTTLQEKIFRQMITSFIKDNLITIFKSIFKPGTVSITEWEKYRKTNNVDNFTKTKNWVVKIESQLNFMQLEFGCFYSEEDEQNLINISTGKDQRQLFEFCNLISGYLRNSLTQTISCISPVSVNKHKNIPTKMMGNLNSTLDLYSKDELDCWVLKWNDHNIVCYYSISVEANKLTEIFDEINRKSIINLKQPKTNCVQFFNKP